MNQHGQHMQTTRKHNDLNARIHDLRVSQNMSQSQFASYFDIPVSTLQDWEHGRRIPPKYVPKMMQRIIYLEQQIDLVNQEQG